MKKTYPPSSLFWTWGAFVFLSVNFFTGIVIAKNNGIGTVLIGTLIGFVLLCIAIFPVVKISTINSRNYSESISDAITQPIVKNLLILMVPLINIGWYSIQIAIVTSLIVSMLPSLTEHAIFVSILLAFLFASGSFLFGYSWLRYFGNLSMAFLIIMVFLNIISYNWDSNVYIHDKFQGDIFFVAQLVFGTWIFSSVTCLMDIASYVKPAKSPYFYIIAALFLADIILILLGFFSASRLNIFSMQDFLTTTGGFLAGVAVILNIWSTNDSNFFSTMRALEAFNINKKYIFLLTCITSGIIAGYARDNLFSLIGKWLIFMGWIGLPLSIFWWIKYLKKNS